MEAASKFWRKMNETVLYEPNARAGWGPFKLPEGHYLHNAACPHDGWYSAAERGDVERTAENKARADVQFFQVGQLDAQHRAKKGGEEVVDYLQYAEDLTDLCLCYLAIRSPIGDLAWNT